jgi:hypothetical protein
LAKNRGYSGRYKLKYKSKYVGDKHNVYYRSLWERAFCKWCDYNKRVVKWAIEPFSIPYFDKGNHKYRRYNPDFYIEMENGKKYLIEIKPDYETKPPKMRKGTKKYILAEQTFKTNQSKWYSATEYCKKRGWEFKVVTEITLEQMGINVLKTPKRKKKRTSKKNVRFSNSTSSGKNKICR